VLRFTRELVDKRGWVSDESIAHLRSNGFGDGEIAEIVANTALNLLTNDFNHVAGTVIDFPRVDELAKH
jgi:alkylhydroperoxidase family enzyme